jgi:hypothetical protein
MWPVMQSKLLEVLNWKVWLPSGFCCAAVAALIIFRKQSINWTVTGGIIAAVGATIAVYGGFRDSERLFHKQEEITVLAQQNFAWVTGGDEFVDVQANFWTDSPGTVSFGISKAGKYPAYDVNISFTDRDAAKEYVEAHMGPDKRLPPVAAIQAVSLRTSYTPIVFPSAVIPRVATFPFVKSNPHSFVADIFSRNGHAGYIYKFATVNGQVLRATRQERSILGVMQTPVETIDPNFPRNPSGKVDW